MKSKLILDRDGERIFALVFDEGDEVITGLRQFANESNLMAAQLTAIGALRDVTLAYFNPNTKEYEKTVIGEQVEVLSLVGNVAAHKDKPKVHAHVVVGKRDCTAHGGHLVEAHVRPTLEVLITESPSHLRRTTDETTGLALIHLD